MRGFLLIIIIIAACGFLIYQYAEHGGIDIEQIFEPQVCPNGYYIGDVVEHVTENFKGLISYCNVHSVSVNLGNGTTTTWAFDEVIEFREKQR